MKLTVLYVGSSLLAPLRNAEREINRECQIDLHLAAYNFGANFTDPEWQRIEQDLGEADVVFVIHVMDGENAARLIPLLDRFRSKHCAVVVINCMPELMKRTRMGKLDFARLPGIGSRKGVRKQSAREDEANSAKGLLISIGSWIGRQARRGSKNGSNGHGHAQYRK